MSKKERILIVDDISDNIQILGSILRNYEYSINIANNGKQALKLLEKIDPDLILLDIMMPEMDGYETIQKIKENPKLKDTPVIFLTAKSDTEDIVKGFNLGAVDYVTKPFNSVELIARIKNHLEIKRARELMSQIEQIEMYRAMVVTTNHNISQPLNVISGNLELIQIYAEESLNEKSKQCLQSAVDACHTIKGLLNKMDSIKKPELIDYDSDEKMFDLGLEPNEE